MYVSGGTVYIYYITDDTLRQLQLHVVRQYHVPRRSYRDRVPREVTWPTQRLIY